MVAAKLFIGNAELVGIAMFRMGARILYCGVSISHIPGLMTTQARPNQPGTSLAKPDPSIA